MPSNSDLHTFQDSAIIRLIKPITEYYDYIGDKDTPGRRNVAKLRLQADMQRTLRELHTEAAVLAQDGALTSEERADLSDLIAKDQDYMQGFINDIPNLSRDTAIDRCQLYLSTITNTYNQFAVYDLPDLPIMPKDESLDCCSRGFPACKCTLRVVPIGKNSWNVYWVLHAKESCEDCIRYNQEWSPLQIRNGIVQSTKEISVDQLKKLSFLVNKLKESGVAVYA